MEAAMGGHAPVVKLLVEAGADKDYKDEDGDTALSVADQGGHTECVRILSASK